MKWRHKFKTRLAWKLMLSYIIVIFVGIFTLIITAEATIPVVYRHHLGSVHHSNAHHLANLLENFWLSATETLLLSTGLSIISAFLAGFFIFKRIDRLLGQIIYATRRIAEGRYWEQVQVPGEDELKQVADSFNMMAASLEQTELMRRELIANVSHELRTPLAGIKIYIEGLIDGVLPPETTTYQRMYREAGRMQRLLDDLQELSRAEAGAFELDLRPVSLNEAIQSTVELLKSQFEEKNIALNLNIQPNLPPVKADKDRLCQILLNLTGNALQYTPSGGQVSITATLNTNRRQEQDMILVSVADNGVGIPAEHLPHIFTRFYRVDKSRSRAGGGSGIGLTIAKHLVEAHGGSIWAESAGKGQGSAFYFSLPAA